MARPKSFASLSVETLLKMRTDIAETLAKKAAELRVQLSMLGSHESKTTKRRNGKAHPAKGKKVAPKYRDPKTKATWAGRGAQPRWLREAIKGGAGLESFAIGKRG